MALRDWHKGKIALVWLLALAATVGTYWLGSGAVYRLANPFIGTLERARAVANAIAPYLSVFAFSCAFTVTWRWFSVRESPRHSPNNDSGTAS